MHICGLELGILRTHEVHEEHGADEADGAEDADRWEILDRVHAGLGEGIESHRIVQADSGHKESHRYGIKREEPRELDSLDLGAIESGTRHKYSGDEMADAEHLLRLDILISQDTDKRGHKERDYTLNGIEPADI